MDECESIEYPVEIELRGQVHPVLSGQKQTMMMTATDHAYMHGANLECVLKSIMKQPSGDRTSRKKELTFSANRVDR